MVTIFLINIPLPIHAESDSVTSSGVPFSEIGSEIEFLKKMRFCMKVRSDIIKRCCV